MEGYDNLGVFFSDNFAGDGDDPTDERKKKLVVAKRKFKDFLREFQEGNFNYKYRLELSCLCFFLENPSIFRVLGIL